MRLLVAAIFAVLTSCAPAPPPVEKPKSDPVKEAWYPEAVEQLAAMRREAADLLAAGKPDDAAAAITRAQPVMNRLLAVPRPTLAAMEAASDLDTLYARMLMSNRHFGWARLLLQKNAVRWKHWMPRTPDTERRMKQAEAGLEECDRRLAEESRAAK